MVPHIFQISVFDIKYKPSTPLPQDTQTAARTLTLIHLHFIIDDTCIDHA